VLKYDKITLNVYDAPFHSFLKAASMTI
jgi:hypothetical protein